VASRKEAGPTETAQTWRMLFFQLSSWENSQLLPRHRGSHDVSERSSKHPSGWSTDPWLLCLGMRSLRVAKPRAERSEGQMLPEQISLHSHPGHDFNLDLEGSHNRGQFIPCAQPEGQGALQKGFSKPLRGLQRGPALPGCATAARHYQASRWAPPDKQDTHPTVSSVRVFYKHSR